MLHAAYACLRGLRRKLQQIQHTTSLKPRHATPFLTHLPVLIGLATLVTVRRVIEFGAGTHSTLSFLDRATFPAVEVLHSFENDLRWANVIGQTVPNDARFTLTFIDQPLYTVVESLDLGAADLIFIDDAKSKGERVKTIESVISVAKGHNIVVIHDYEQRMYQCAAAAAPYAFHCKALNPNCGVLWFGRDCLSRQDLRKLDDTIHRFTPQIALDNIAEWKRLFDQQLGIRHR